MFNENKTKTLTPSQIKRKQTLVFISMFGTIIILCSIFIFSTEDDTEKKQLILNSDNNKIVLSDLSKGASAEDRWLEISEEKVQALEELNHQQQEKLQLLEKAIDEMSQKYANDMMVAESSSFQIQTLEQEIENIKKSGGNNSYLEDETNNLYGAIPIAKTIETVSFDLETEEDNNENIHNIKDYLPAGSYVSAKVISGVDASVGLSSSSDPRPVLFRITGKAISSLFKNKQLKTDLKGCIVTGAASGDLSSEKVFVRLLKMTCSKSKDTVIETEVKGYATAIGKAGIRGQVVSREGNLLTKSFFAGVIGGMGNMSSKALNPTLEINSGIATEQVSSRDILKQGLSDGVSKSSDRLSEYLIDRAEQYQPVISIPAGIDVELVFHSGVYLDGREIKTPQEQKQSLVYINNGEL